MQTRRVWSQGGIWNVSIIGTGWSESAQEYKELNKDLLVIIKELRYWE